MHAHAWQVEAAGVNRLDLLQAHGKYPPPPGESEILGVEGGMCTQFTEKGSLFSLVPGPHPLTGLVNQVEFLGLVFSLIPRPRYRYVSLIPRPRYRYVSLILVNRYRYVSLIPRPRERSN